MSVLIFINKKKKEETKHLFIKVIKSEGKQLSSRQ